ncbi:helix-turn-helix domain-containing protein [Pedobacter duraquae]|uniref:Transcriptional regulator with XRE-family HTH domain n=1 Tax=Pedobacter duraquae TaxID=425511 RepID=A0A4R6IK90_9SPHI|nr:helix-turn-helix transcriptional regulator [Pedobacter duraquae]TDO22472.1 transcriptional regulator with XRE-family HTH domain [Pedobacter duraquae]
MNNIGKNIRMLRHKNGWNQGEVAKRLNISIPAFSKIETGFTDINISRLHQIAGLFNVSIIEILAKEGDAPIPEKVDELNELKEKLLAREQDLLSLQKKLIELYEEVRKK